MESLDAALALYRRGQLTEAEAMTVRMLAAARDRRAALALLADLRSAAGRVAAAIPCWQELAALAPLDAANWRRLGQALVAVGRPADALGPLERAVGIEPENIRGLNNLGQALLQLGRYGEAIGFFERAVALAPDYAIGLTNWALAAERLARLPQALSVNDRLLELQPSNADALLRRGRLLWRLNRAGDALPSLAAALALRPTDVEALEIRAAVLCQLQRHAEALPDLERVLALVPTNLDAWCNCALLQLQLGDQEAAMGCYRHALSLDPQHTGARCGLVAAVIPPVPGSIQESRAARAEFEREIAAFETWIATRELAEADAWTLAKQHFFYLSYQEESNMPLLKRYRGASAARLARYAPTAAPPAPRPRNSGSVARFRLGIVSAQVFDHSVFNAMTRGWLANLDRDRFEISLFHLGSRRDASTEWAERRVARFEAQPRTDAQWARAIRGADLHALLFPEVGINRSSLALASLRLAPRQFAAWGHPETTGLPTIDVFLSAAGLEPPDADAHYAERLVRLPNLGVYYQPYDVNLAPCDVAALDLASDRPLLICPGTPFKYDPRDDALLVEIARRLGACTFAFFTYERPALSERLRTRLSAAFAAAGLDPERFLKWLPWQPRGAFLALLARADVYLDTLRFSGFNTLMQAVEVSLPCVSHEGLQLRGRLGSGILRQLGLPELVATDGGSYVEIAVRLASDRPYRRDIAAKMQLAAPRAYADRSAVEALERALLG